MHALNSRERFLRILTGKDVDRAPFFKVFGGTNAVCHAWEKNHPNIGSYIDELIGFEGKYRGWDVARANYQFVGLPENKILEENDEYIIIKQGDGTVVREEKDGYFNTHILEYPVKTQRDWEELKEKHLCVDVKKRLPGDWANYALMYNNRDYPLQLSCRGVYGFLRTMMGDELLSYNFYDEPELVKDITDTYISTMIELWEIMCKDVQFDLIESWEDMAYNKGSLVSPSTFEEFLTPSFRRIRNFADEHDIPIVLVDSDGKIDNLVDCMHKSGVNAMYPFEVQSDNDVIAVLNRYEDMGAVGCLNKNCMAATKKEIDEEIERARGLIKTGRIVPGPDHFVLEDVSFENYYYFMTELKKAVFETKLG